MKFFGRSLPRKKTLDTDSGRLAVLDATVIEDEPPKTETQYQAQVHMRAMIEHWNNELKLNMKKDFDLVQAHVASVCDHPSNIHKCLACQERSALQVQRNDIKEFMRIFLKQ
jgi:hypothetical protein